jgi:hypothetical protein
MSLLLRPATGVIPKATLGRTYSGRNGLVLGLALVVASLSWTTFRMARRLSGEPYVDFYAFYWAARAADSGGDIYEAGTRMYIYPPMLATGFVPIGRLPVIEGAWVWYGLALAATLLTLRGWWNLVAKSFRLPAGGWWPAVGLALAVWIDQFRWECEASQTDWLIMAALVFAGVLLTRAPALAGLLIGFAINIKYLPLLVVVWLAVRRRWEAAAAAMVGVIVFALLPATVIGWDRNLDYLARAGSGLGKLVGFHADGQPGMVFPLEFAYSVSIPSGAARVSNLIGLGKAYAALLIAAAAAAAAFAGGRIYRRHGLSLLAGNGPAGLHVLELVGVMTLMLAFSPQTQNRHLYMLLPAVLLGTAFIVNRIEPVKAAAALAIGVLGTALLGDANAIDEEGAVNWGCVGGGGITVVVMYLVLLDAGLRRLRAGVDFTTSSEATAGSRGAPA